MFATLEREAWAARLRLQGKVRLPVAATVLAVVVAALARWGPDWPAQEFRALLARSQPLAWWANGWFSGQPLGGYSLLFPLLSGVFGVAAVGVASVAISAVSAGRLIPRGSAWSDVLAEIAVVASLVSSLLQGQVPYLLGTAFGLCALSLDRANRRWLAALAAGLCCLASPLAGAFLLLGAAATTAVRPVRALAPYSAVLVGFAVPIVFGGASGSNPYPVTSLAAALVFGMAVIVAFRGAAPLCRVLTRFGVLYLITAVALLPVGNAVGGNIDRLGMQLAPVLACLALRRAAPRRCAAAAVAGTLAVAWAVWPAAASIAHGAGDPSQQRAFFTPLLRYLTTQRSARYRVEIPMTRDHWEARWVAPRLPLARGWERQTDIQSNSVLYRPLAPTGYRQWLSANAVGWVALPKLALDTGGVAEAALLHHPPTWLREVWRNADWTVWRVRNATPIASAPATLEHLGQTTITLRFQRAGASLLRVHSAPLWRIVRGQGCLETTAAGWLRVIAPRGRLVLSAGWPGTAPDWCRAPAVSMSRHEPLGVAQEASSFVALTRQHGWEDFPRGSRRSAAQTCPHQSHALRSRCGVAVMCHRRGNGRHVAAERSRSSR